MAPSLLVKKLRIQPGQRILILNAPSGYAESLGELPEGAEVSDVPEGESDFIHPSEGQQRIGQSWPGGNRGYQVRPSTADFVSQAELKSRVRSHP
jgi:hypothetical protein